jgi:hypothetical protein
MAWNWWKSVNTQWRGIHLGECVSYDLIEICDKIEEGEHANTAAIGRADDDSANQTAK